MIRYIENDSLIVGVKDFGCEIAMPKPIFETKEKSDGSISICAKYDYSIVDYYIKEIAREISDKFDACVIEELMKLNGYVPERTCRMKIVKQGPLYIVYSFDCCDKEWVESMTDGKATALDGTVCPYCGARVKEES